MDWPVSELCSISLKIFLCESCFLAAENQTGNKRIFFKKQTIPCLSPCRGVLLTTQREEKTQTMKQAPCPPAVSVGKEQNQSKAIEHTQWPCLLPFLRHKAGGRVLFSPPPPTSPCHSGSLACWPPGCLLSFLRSSAGTVLTSSLTVQIAVLIHQLACSLIEWLWTCETVWGRNKSHLFVGNES